MTRLLSSAALVMSIASAAAQTPPPALASGVIRGRVVTSDGRPMKQVIVRAMGSTVRMQRGGLTDGEGRFELKDLAGDTYTITVNRAGYFPIDGARRATAGKRVGLRDGEVLERVDVVIARGSSITGRVADEDGEPIEGAAVHALQLRFANGRRQVMEVGRLRTTNDLGQFRIYGLPPGQYLTSVVPPDTGANRLPGYQITYYPGSPAVADAQLVAVEIGHDTQNVDVRLSPGRAARISGTVMGGDSRPLTGAVVLANSQRSGGPSVPPRQVILRSDGTFEIASVGPGEYVLQAWVFSSEPQGLFASQLVTVGDEDVKGVALPLSAGSNVAGRITVEGDAAGVRPSTFFLATIPADFDATPLVGNTGYRATIRDDWSFETKGLFGPMRFRLVDPPAGWMIRSVRSGGGDVTDTPMMFGRPNQSLDDVEIVVTNRASSIAGTVSDAKSQPVADSVVIAFSTDRDRWYRESRFLKYTLAEPDGSFTVRGLPAGDYVVAAVDWMQPSPGFGEWQDPEVLEALARRASRVTLADSQRAHLGLKVVPR
jgi:protocatechuate 3,4-dioxygenase beta subunit